MTKKITISDIAEMSKTSKTTVSFYLNGKTKKMSAETQERIKKAIEETNYRPSLAARSLNSKKLKLIGVIIGDITNTFANQIVKGIDAIAQESGYRLMVTNSNYDPKVEQDAVEHMLAMGVDGIIVQPTTEFDKIMGKIKASKKPIVFIDSQLRSTQGYWVKTNNYEAVLEATEIMIEKGYEDFIIITAEPGVLSTRMERYKGFEDGVTLHDKKMTRMTVDGHTSSVQIAEFLAENIDKSKKTLVFVPNCWALPKVFIALKPLRTKIPYQIGLIGIDNLEWTELASPTVTTIVQPSYKEGQQAMKILIDTIEGSYKEAPNQILKCRINEQDSTLS